MEKSHQATLITIKTKQKTKTLRVRSQFGKACVPNVSLLFEWAGGRTPTRAFFRTPSSHIADLGNTPLTLSEMGFAHAGLFIKKKKKKIPSPPIKFLSNRQTTPLPPSSISLFNHLSSSLLPCLVSELLLLLSRHIWEPLWGSIRGYCTPPPHTYAHGHAHARCTPPPQPHTHTHTRFLSNFRGLLGVGESYFSPAIIQVLKPGKDWKEVKIL